MGRNDDYPKMDVDTAISVGAGYATSTILLYVTLGFLLSLAYLFSLEDGTMFCFGVMAIASFTLFTLFVFASLFKLITDSVSAGIHLNKDQFSTEEISDDDGTVGENYSHSLSELEIFTEEVKEKYDDWTVDQIHEFFHNGWTLQQLVEWRETNLSDFSQTTDPGIEDIENELRILKPMFEHSISIGDEKTKSNLRKRIKVLNEMRKSIQSQVPMSLEEE